MRKYQLKKYQIGGIPNPVVIEEPTEYKYRKAKDSELTKEIEYRNWLENWYTNRILEEPSDNEKLENIRYQLVSKVKNIPVNYSTQFNRSNSDVRGQYNPSTNDITMFPSTGDNTLLHELTHGSTNFDEMGYFKAKLDVPNNKPFEYVSEKDKKYYQSGEENLSRLMVLRKLAGFKPNQTVTKEELSKFLNQNSTDSNVEILNEQYDEDYLLNMLNRTVSLNSKSNYAQSGGQASTYTGIIDDGVESINLYNYYNYLTSKALKLKPLVKKLPGVSIIDGLVKTYDRKPVSGLAGLIPFGDNILQTIAPNKLNQWNEELAKQIDKVKESDFENLYQSGGTIPDRYKDMGFSKVGQSKKSTREGKKWMVLARKGDKYKVVHGGDSNMQDFSQHKDKQRQKNFWNRMGTTTDQFSPRYWHKKLGKWESGGIQEMGYKDNSPFKNEPYIDINSNQITMQGVSKPLIAIPNNDKSIIMQPNKNYFFPNSTSVREIPLQAGGSFTSNPYTNKLTRYNSPDSKQLLKVAFELERNKPNYNEEDAINNVYNQWGKNLDEYETKYKQQMNDPNYVDYMTKMGKMQAGGKPNQEYYTKEQNIEYRYDKSRWRPSVYTDFTKQETDKFVKLPNYNNIVYSEYLDEYFFREPNGSYKSLLEIATKEEIEKNRKRVKFKEAELKRHHYNPFGSSGTVTNQSAINNLGVPFINSYQAGGEANQEHALMQLFQAYFQMNGLQPEQIEQFIAEFQGMSPEEQQQVVQYIQQSVEGQQAPVEQQSQPMQEQQVQEPMAQGYAEGGMYFRDEPVRYRGMEYAQGGYGDSNVIVPDTMYSAPMVVNTSNYRGSYTPVKQGIPERPLLSFSKADEKKVEKAVIKERVSIDRKMANHIEENKLIQQALNYEIQNGVLKGKLDTDSLATKKTPSGVDGIIGTKTTNAIKDYGNEIGVDYKEAYSILKSLGREIQSLPNSTTEPQKETSTSTFARGVTENSPKTPLLFARGETQEQDKTRDGVTPQTNNPIDALFNKKESREVKQSQDEFLSQLNNYSNNRISPMKKGGDPFFSLEALDPIYEVFTGKTVDRTNVSDKLRDTNETLNGRRVYFHPETLTLVTANWSGGYERITNEKDLATLDNRGIRATLNKLMKR